VGWMLVPVAAAILMAVALGWFGLHVLQREVIFVDLALAQIAALGATYAVFLGHEADEPIAYGLGLAFTVLGASAFAALRHLEDRVPTEALVGVTYVVCAAAGALLLDFSADPHGAEKLQHLMVGNLVWTTTRELGTMAAVIALVAMIHAAVRGPLLEVSFAPEKAKASGRSLVAWDLFFYLTFGVVISALVHVAGVLLIFSYLIIPAVIARLWVHGTVQRLLVGWAVAVPISVLGVAASYEHAAAPIIVVLLAAVLFASILIVAVRSSPAPARTTGLLAASLAAVSAVLWAGTLVPSEHDHEETVGHAHDVQPLHDDLPAKADATAREAWYREHVTAPDALLAALPREDDTSLRLLLATALVRDGRREGLDVLVAITADELPFMRMEADDRLKLLAGDAAPSTDPLAGPSDAAWRAWAATAQLSPELGQRIPAP